MLLKARIQAQVGLLMGHWDVATSKVLGWDYPAVIPATHLVHLGTSILGVRTRIAMRPIL